MIGKLSGIIDSFGGKFIILDVQGVGYIVHASGRTMSRIGQVGDAAQLLIEMQVREDSMTLFGFIDLYEQQWFKLLTSVQGVGAKAGLAILSVAAPERLGAIIASQDKAGLTQADGVGPKLATRILSELKDKAGSIAAPLNISTDTVSVAQISDSDIAEGAVVEDSVPVAANINEDVLSALTNLGYARADAYQALEQGKLKSDGNNDLQTIIRLALKELSS